jgi:hypothetical protein
MQELDEDLKGLEYLGLTEDELALEKLKAIWSDADPADYIYWSKASYWSHDEVVALLLGLDPEVVNWNSIEQEDIVRGFRSIMPIVEYKRLRNLVLRAFEMNEIGINNSPALFLKWAESRCIEIPEGLKKAVSAMENQLAGLVETESAQLLKIKEEEIAKLEKRIQELENLVWEGFDERKETYSKELAIAVKAHAAVSKDWKKKGKA